MDWIPMALDQRNRRALLARRQNVEKARGRDTADRHNNAANAVPTSTESPAKQVRHPMVKVNRKRLRAVSTANKYTWRLFCAGTIEAKNPREARLKIKALLGIDQLKPMPKGLVVVQEK